MSPDVTAFFDDATNTVSYVVCDPNGSHCAIIDSVLDFDYASGRTDTASADAIIAHVEDPRADRRLASGNPCARRPPLCRALSARTSGR